MARHITNFALTGFSVVVLTACASGKEGSKATTTTTTANEVVNTVSNTVPNSTQPVLESKTLDQVMQTALANAEAHALTTGNKKEVIATLEQILQANPDDAIIATRLARELRESDQMGKAARVLKPYTEGEAPNVEALTEMSMTQIALGNYDAAKNHALQSTVIDPTNARGFLALGTAQDALKDHGNAEQAFRQGLEHWQGDPSPILNNLALNLASQGHLNESLSLLERAVKISPERMELERNRRIIATLVETATPMAPSPSTKPEVNIPDTARP